MRKPSFIFLLSLWLLASMSRGQSVRWDPPGGQLGFNQVSELALIFEDCEPDGLPALPPVSGLQFGRPSQSSQTSIVNFKMSRTFSYVFPVRPDTRNTITIPDFEIKTDKGTMKVAAARYTVGDATVGNSGLTVDDVASAKLTTPRQSVWAGEVFPVTYSLEVVRRYFHSLGSNLEWQGTPAIAEDWTKPDPSEVLLRGERRVVSNQETRATIKQPGIYSLKPAAQMVNLMVGTSGFGLFTQPNVEQRQINSSALELTVKALPPAPPEFSGAVGDFAFIAKVVPLTAAIGEPITWTLELKGTGNWPDISGLPQREASNDFQVVQPKSKRTMKDNSLFDGALVEDVVLVPTKTGSYRLAPVRFNYFDPKSGTYKTITTEPVTVTIAGTSAPMIPPASSGAPIQFTLNTPTTPTPALPTAVAPAPPQNLPSESITTPARGWTPHAIRPLVWLCILVSLLAPLLLWLTLAAIRSRTLDPQRQRREALRALAATLTELRQSGTKPAAQQAALKAWQTHVAVLWVIPHAAPGTPLVHACVTRLKQDAAAAWSKLWSEADRALHSRDAALPQDWPMRAEGALRAVTVPGWNPFTLFAGRHLLPFLFTLLVLLAPVAAQADAGSDAYKRGDFAAAETAWQKTLAADKTDWTARHNLGLALGQQDRWAEATAYWTSAFLLNSRAEATRWDLKLGLERSGLAQPLLVEFSRGEGRYQLARLATPGEWQLALLLAALLLAVALILLLLQGYRRIGVWGKPLALSAMLVAMVIAAVATFSLRIYGPLANPSVVFVWNATTLRSIPTEADTAQKTSPLSAGSIAIAEKNFLGWTKLGFPGGQTGWVRTEELIPLYR